jgi:hypothetical protein
MPFQVIPDKSVNIQTLANIYPSHIIVVAYQKSITAGQYLTVKSQSLDNRHLFIHCGNSNSDLLAILVAITKFCASGDFTCRQGGLKLTMNGN